MKIYEDESQNGEWNITSTLTLEDTGQFLFDEWWTCYWGSAGGTGNGRWWQSGETIFFHTERAEGNTLLDLLPGRDRIAIEEGDIIKFSESVIYRRNKRATANIQQPSESNTLTTAPNTDEKSVTFAPATVNSISLPKNEHLKLSPELASRMRQWIDELPAAGFQNRIARLGKKFNFLPLHTNSIYMWALDLDGVVMWLDHESLSDQAEQVTDPLTIYAVMVHGARIHRELAGLIPPRPEGVRQCDECGGMGWKKCSGEEGTESCFRCESLGWYVRAAPG